MKSIQTTLIVITAGLLLQSCHKGSMWGIKGEGDSVPEKRSVNGFNAIDLSIDANITYVQDSVYSVEISAQKNILTILETKVENSELKMDFKRNVWKYGTVNVIIHSPAVNKINISGSGDIVCKNNIKTGNLDLIISGSGNISIASVSLQTLSVKISGSGNIDINEGSCKSEYFNISGTGNITAEFLYAVNADAKISGSGDITLNASSTLNVTISGSGNVKYRGQPTINSDISGFGKLTHLD